MSFLILDLAYSLKVDTHNRSISAKINKFTLLDSIFSATQDEHKLNYTCLIFVLMIKTNHFNF